MFRFFIALFIGASFLQSSGAASITRPSFSVQNLGTTHPADKSFKNVHRDGGGGGFVNGKHLIVFSDTATMNGDQMTGFTCNSVAYTSSKHPTKLTDFGENGVPFLGVPWLANETAMIEKMDKDKDRLIIWPSSSIAPVSGTKSGIAVYQLVRIHPDRLDLGGELLYSTMVQYKPTSRGPGATRLVPTLFYPHEIQYGTFSAVPSLDKHYINLFATVGNNALSLARVPMSKPSSRANFAYWSPSGWASHMPSANSGSAYVVTDSRGFASGDFIYSDHLQTWILIYMVKQLDSTFHFRYSTTGLIQGPYTEPAVLYKTTPAKDDFNFAGHAYGGYDSKGKSVILSWTYDKDKTMMAKVKFE